MEIEKLLVSIFILGYPEFHFHFFYIIFIYFNFFPVLKNIIYNFKYIKFIKCCKIF